MIKYKQLQNFLVDTWGVDLNQNFILDKNAFLTKPKSATYLSYGVKKSPFAAYGNHLQGY